MPTPPRTIERIPSQRLAELPELERQLTTSIDLVKLAQAYGSEAPHNAADRLERARVAVAGVLEELNTFRAPARKAGADNGAVAESIEELQS